MSVRHASTRRSSAASHCSSISSVTDPPSPVTESRWAENSLDPHVARSNAASASDHSDDGPPMDTLPWGPAIAQRSALIRSIAGTSR